MVRKRATAVASGDEADRLHRAEVALRVADATTRAGALLVHIPKPDRFTITVDEPSRGEADFHDGCRRLTANDAQRLLARRCGNLVNPRDNDHVRAAEARSWFPQ
jgi:hypothetical protein